jgi:hypothetical protein
MRRLVLLPPPAHEGIKVATVRDPFGNVLGIVQNPHFGRG